MNILYIIIYILGYILAFYMHKRVTINFAKRYELKRIFRRRDLIESFAYALLSWGWVVMLLILDFKEVFPNSKVTERLHNWLNKELYK